MHRFTHVSGRPGHTAGTDARAEDPIRSVVAIENVVAAINQFAQTTLRREAQAAAALPSFPEQPPAVSNGELVSS